MVYFEGVNKIQYEGSNSKNPFAFKYYNPEGISKRINDGRITTFFVAYWHTFTADGSDPFGVATMIRPWDKFRVWIWLKLE